MLPQRKSYETTQPAPDIADALELSRDWVYQGDVTSAAQEPITSPARMLHQQLQMRLGDLVTPASPAARAPALTIEAKWPMPARIATIVTISTLLWGGIYLALVHAITG